MILLISGYKNSGKDTAAEIIKKFGFEQHSFAKPLKDHVSNKYNLPRHWFDDRELKDRAMISMPVSITDNTSKFLLDWLGRELMTINDTTTISQAVINNIAYGRSSESIELQPLYWTPRALCILEGATARMVDSNYWTKQIPLDKNIVISDWRFINEYNALRDLVGTDNIKTIRIKRQDSISQDTSERDLDNFTFDYIIENDSSLEVFGNRVNWLVSEFVLPELDKQ